MRTKVSELTPTSISNLIAWWDASEGVTTSSGFVSNWFDKIGSKDAAQSNSSYRPLYSSSSSNLNSNPSIIFDGLNDYLVYNNEIQVTPDFTYIIVCHPTDNSIEMRLSSWIYNNPPQFFMPLRLYTNSTSSGFARVDNAGQITPQLSSWSINNTYVFSTTYEENVEFIHYRDKNKSVAKSVTSDWQDGGANSTGIFPIGTNRNTDNNLSLIHI